MPRTGVVGRLARFVIAGVAAAGVVSIADEGGLDGFARLPITEEPGVWLIMVLTVGAYLALVQAVASGLGSSTPRRWQLVGAAGLFSVLVVSAAASALTNSAMWGRPLSDVWWWFMVLMLAETVLASVIAVGLGTPGCEVGVWGELLARARGGRARVVVGPACVVGIHFIDAWEASRRASRQHGHRGRAALR